MTDCPTAEASTDTTTEIFTVHEVQVTTSLVTEVITTTEEVTQTVTSTGDLTVEKTLTLTTTAPCGAPDPGLHTGCPTLTSTGTACNTCLVPGCTSRVEVTRSCGCPPLPTTTVNFRCNDPDVCNHIACRTVYDVVTAQGC